MRRGAPAPTRQWRARATLALASGFFCLALAAPAHGAGDAGPPKTAAGGQPSDAQPSEAQPREPQDAGTRGSAADDADGGRASLPTEPLDDAEAKRVLEGAARQSIAAERQAATAAREEAERAHAAALEQSRTAMSLARRELAELRATLEGVRLTLAQERERSATEAQAEAAAAEARRQGDDTLSLQSRSAAGVDADLLYDQLVIELTARRSDLRSAIDTLEQAPSTTAVPPSPGAVAPELADELRAIERLRASLVAESESVANVRHAARLAEAARLASEAQELNAIRIALLERLTPDRRRAVLGLGRDGVHQLVRELGHAQLMLRWYPHSRGASWASMQHALQDVLNLGTTASFLTRSLILAALLFVLMRKRKAWLAAARTAALHSVRSTTWRGLIDVVGRGLENLSGHLLLLVGVMLVFDWLLADLTLAEVKVLGAVLGAFAWYRVLSHALHQLIVAVARSDRRRLGEDMSAKLLGSVRLVGRVALVLYVVTTSAAAVLGRGYLYHLIVEVAWLSALPVAWLLLRSWRPEITSTYLRLQPEGRLASAVERTRERWFGFFIAIAAFGVLAANAVTSWSRQRLLGLEQTRRALAFFFRRRLQQQAESAGAARAPQSLDVLPAPWRAAFAEAPTDTPLPEGLCELQEVATALAARRARRVGTVIALVGPAGSGKTSWLRELARQLEVPAEPAASADAPAPPSEPGVHLITLRGRVGVPELCTAFALAGIEASTVPELQRALELRAGEVFIFDECERLFLRDVDAYDGFRGMTELLAEAGSRCCFVLAFAQPAWQTVSQIVQRQEVFRRIVTLGAWTEEGIGALLRSRARMAGLTPRYQDLVVDTVGGAAYDAAVIRTAHGFERLLWDYADGIPRDALHFWLRSLVPVDEHNARVVLFEAPAADGLDDLSANAREIVATIYRHDRITEAEIARVLRAPSVLVDAVLDDLLDRGVLTLGDGEVRISTHWDRAAFRFLKRTNLLD